MPIELRGTAIADQVRDLLDRAVAILQEPLGAANPRVVQVELEGLAGLAPQQPRDVPRRQSHVRRDDAQRQIGIEVVLGHEGQHRSDVTLARARARAAGGRAIRQSPQLRVRGREHRADVVAAEDGVDERQDVRRRQRTGAAELERDLRQRHPEHHRFQRGQRRRTLPQQTPQHLQPRCRRDDRGSADQRLTAIGEEPQPRSVVARNSRHTAMRLKATLHDPANRF